MNFGPILNSIKKNVNVPGMVDDLLDGWVKPELEAFVAKSENKIDDVLAAALYPTLSAFVKQQVRDLWSKVVVPVAQQ